MTETTALKPCVPSELLPPLNYTIITDDAGLVKVRDFMNRVSVFVIDTETNMVDDFTQRRIRTIQLGDRNEQYVIDLLPFAQRAGVTLEDAQGWYKPHSCFQELIDTLNIGLDSRTHTKVGHNLTFDYEVMKFCLGLRMWNLYDTMLTEKVLYSGIWNFKMSGIWALDDCVERYCGMTISKKEQTSFNLYDELTENQKVYCALDCRLPLAIKSGQRDKLVKQNLMKAAQIENDCIPAFADMHLNGINLDKGAWSDLVKDIEREHKLNVAKLDEFFIPVVGSKEKPDHDLAALELTWKTTTDKEVRANARKTFMAARKQIAECAKNWDKYEGMAAINYGSNPQLLAALRKLGFDKTKLKDTDDRSLKMTAEHPKWDMKTVREKDPDYKLVGVIDTLRLYRETGKLLSTYGWDWVRPYSEDGHVNPWTGRIHSIINQLGAETGRTSSVKPNIQNLPKGKHWRGAFRVSNPDYRLITLDYNGCELRILAEYSQEKVFIDAFLKGWDVHSVGAEIIFGDEWKNAAEEGCAYYKDHQKCSCKKHKDIRDQVKAINFGIAYGMEAKKLSEEVGITEEQATALLAKYRKSFPTLVKYLTASGDRAKMKYEARTLSQRRRCFHKPTWADAVKKAQERLKKKGFDSVPSTRQIGSAYKAMYSAIEREGKNTPIQGSNADIAKIAMGCAFGKDGKEMMWHGLEPRFGAKMVNFIHDEFVVEVHKDKADECFKFMAECMERGGAELVKCIPMTTEGHIADRWTK
jgi:DNA polymerase-1